MTSFKSQKFLCFAALFSICAINSPHAAEVKLQSQHVLVVDAKTGVPLLEKNANDIVPIASLTKLMTAMVVLDAKLDMREQISIATADVDVLKHSRSRVPVGATLSRGTLLHLALMSSDNRAAASLARTFPGGQPAFQRAMNKKLMELGMRKTVIQEPTGLSARNTSTATDLIRMTKAAAGYPTITKLSTISHESFDIKGRTLSYRNSNSFVGRNGWGIKLSKTGYTQEAGRCVVMKLQAAGRNALVVLLNANGAQARAADMASIKRYLSVSTNQATPKIRRTAVKTPRKSSSAPRVERAIAATSKPARANAPT